MGNELTNIDYEKLDVLSVASNKGAVAFERVGEMMDFAKLMSVSDIAVRKHLRNNAGACLAIVVQANEWGLSPFAVANKSFLVNDQMAYESQLLHAVIERRAPLKERLRFEFEGEGPDLMVRVTGHLRGETTPLVYESPRFKDIKVKNSPLWIGDPKQQFTYYGARAWGRRFVPDVLLGLYAEDELDNARNLGAENAKDITPGTEEPLHHRLSAKAAAAAGFDPAGIANTIDEASGRAAPAEPVKETAAASTPAVDDAADTSATNSPVASDVAVVGAAAGIRTPAAANIQETPAEDGAATAGIGAEAVAVGVAPLADQAAEASALPSETKDSQGDGKPAKVSAPYEAAPEAAAGGATTSAAVEPKETKRRHAYKPPALPKVWAEYKDYVRQALLGPGKDDAEMVRSWWNSDYEKSMRARLRAQTVDGGDAVMDEARILVNARIEELKARP